MKGYAVVEFTEVTDQAVFNDFIERVPLVIEALGGKYLIRGGAIEVVRGEWRPSRFVVMEFESMEQARAWNDSPDYAELKKMLHGSCKTNELLMEGV